MKNKLKKYINKKIENLKKELTTPILKTIDDKILKQLNNQKEQLDKYIV